MRFVELIKGFISSLNIKMEEDIEPVEASSQQKLKLYEQYEKLKVPDEKQSLCRYYLRGLCVFPKAICKYSHGVEDLQFKQYNNQDIVWEYKRTDFNQNKLIPKQCRYVNLYEFQKEKVYTQDQLNSDRKIRAEVREEMIRNECEKFMDLLGELYPKQEFTEKFIEREFTRAGFNKPTSTLSFKKICEYLCSSVNSRFMLGKINGKSALIEKLSPEEVDREFAQIIKKKLMEFENVKIPEQDIKRLVFQENSNARLPPLNHHLKVLKMSFMDYVKGLLAKDEQVQKIMEDRKLSFQGEPNTPDLVAWSIRYFEKSDKIVLIDKWVSDLINEFKLSNNNAIGPVRVELANLGFRFFYLPMITFIYNAKSTKEFKQQPCYCKFKEKPDLSCLVMEPPLAPLQQVQVIDSDQSFEKCSLAFLTSKVLAVDIEGRLRKGGFVQIIQFNNGKNVFLFDIYAITQIAFNFDLYERVKLIIREKMLDASVLKIFHDSRHDCLSLHQIFNTCTFNVFDTSGMQIYKNEMEVYENSKQITSAILNGISNVRTPGLNQILKKYEAPHGINQSKDEFHRLMSIGTTFGGIFHQRPLHPQYKKYCVKDVLDLIHVYEIMRKPIPQEISTFIGDRYVQNAYESTL